MDPDEILAAMDAVSGGPHPGARGAHAKGVLCAGRFVPAPEARALSAAAHLQGEPTRVTVRFSNGSGNPGAADGERGDGRGMAVKLYLPDGTTTDLVCLTLPVFFVRTAADFLAFVRARRPDPETGQPDFERLGALLAEHPETAAALQLVLPTLTAPVSYATCAYNSLHAFWLVDAGGDRRAVRYRFEPDAGVAALDDEQAQAAAPDYLQRDVRDRLASGTIGFTLLAVLAEPGDPLDDPTAPWPAERERVPLGRLELDGLDTTRGHDGDVLVFDPTRVTAGIELTDDEIVRTRSDVYAASVARRTGVARA
jgi:catalase